MFKMFKNFFSSRRDSTSKNAKKLHIFLDTLNSRNKISMKITFKKEMTIKQLRKEVSDENKIDMDNLVLLINFRFWEDDCTVNDAINGMNLIDGGYIVYAVMISTAEEENIDYDIEKRLKEKYSSDPILEPEYEMVQNISPKKEEVVELPMACPLCMSMIKRESMVILAYCNHEFCRDCLSRILHKSIGDNVKCPSSECQRLLNDFEYQKILGRQEYDKYCRVVSRKFQGDETFKTPKTGWVCQNCTYLNKPYLKFCDTCNDNRPIEYIIPGFYVATKEERLIKKQDEEDEKRQKEELRQQEAEKESRLKELKNLSRQSVTMTTETTTCPICDMDYGPGEAIVLHSCLHIVCKDCLTNYLMNVDDALVKCPTVNCVGLMENREIKAILPETEYQKYEELSMRQAEAKEQGSFHCKEVNCTAWVVKDGNVSSFHCPLCGKKNCILCEAIHEGKTCQEYQMIKLSQSLDPSQSKNDIYIQSMINSGEAMKCPGCRMIVEKNRGCDGVLCRGCGMMICWATKGPRWGPKGKGDRSGGCGCRFMWGRRCHPNCHYCH